MNKHGDGLITFMSFAFGLGALNLAYEGLYPKEVTFKWIVTELFWVAFGLFFLFVGWRGFIKKDENEEESEPNEQPLTDRVIVQSRNTEPNEPKIAHGKTNAKSSTQSLSVFREKEPPALDKRKLPPTMELYPSRTRAVVFFVITFAFAAGCAWQSIVLSYIFGAAFGLLVAVPWVIACAKVIISCVRHYFWEGPMLVLDEEGITDYRRKGHFISWREIDAARIEAHHARTCLVIRFRSLADVKEHFGSIRMIETIFGRLLYKGFEGNIRLTSLKYEHHAVLRVTHAFIRNARLTKTV